MSELVPPEPAHARNDPVTVDHEDRRPPGQTATAGNAAASAGNAAASAVASAAKAHHQRRVRGMVVRLIDAIRLSDDAAVERAVVQLSQTRRWLAPLALVVGAFLMLFQGLKLLVTNWRLTLVQILPAMWIWVAMLDLKVHALKGRTLHSLYGPILLPAILAVTALTAASFYLNGVFAFAISTPGKPEIRPAFAKARAHLRTILAWG